MKFGPVPLDQAAGALLAHSCKVASGKIAKGTELTSKHLEQMAAAGMTEVTVARLSPGDAHENDAAARVAEALVPDGAAAGLELTDAFTGRVNLIAKGPGIVQMDVGAIHALNLVDPMLTLATVPEYARVTEGMLVGTVKIISYAVPDDAVTAACDAARGAIRILSAQVQSAGLVLTELTEADAKLRDKSIASIRTRVEQLGVSLTETEVCGHRADEVAACFARMNAEVLLLLTASATSDIDDVGPHAVRAAGGQVTRFGMPVDPGNLLFIGEMDSRPVIGLPGCARSPALNGADWVMERVICGAPPSAVDIARMGVGGLLKEIPTRPQPRQARRAAE